MMRSTHPLYYIVESYPSKGLSLILLAYFFFDLLVKLSILTSLVESQLLFQGPIPGASGTLYLPLSSGYPTPYSLVESSSSSP